MEVKSYISSVRAVPGRHFEPLDVRPSVATPLKRVYIFFKEFGQ